MGEFELAKKLRDFATLADDKFLFYLWIIQKKLDRKPPTKQNSGVWFEPLNAARQDPKFRKCYELFKVLYDDITDIDFFTQGMVEKYEDWFIHLTEKGI
jgi:hypothetical protein